MRIQTSNDNEKTAEFLWKRSANLAHLVSQKLTNAARSLLTAAKPTEVAAQNQTSTH